jgi:hypothetical protein
MAKSINDGITLPWFIIPVLPLTSSVILDRLLKHTVPLVSHLWNGKNSGTYMVVVTKIK